MGHQRQHPLHKGSLEKETGHGDQKLQRVILGRELPLLRPETQLLLPKGAGWQQRDKDRPCRDARQHGRASSLRPPRRACAHTPRTCLREDKGL